MAGKNGDDGGVIEGELEDAGSSKGAEALTLITAAEIDKQIATAKQYPRNLAKVKAKIADLACLDEETAESCFYSLKRQDADGKQNIIQGPSIRMAEIALSCFGNIRAGTRSMGETPDREFIIEQGVCFDVENNVMVTRETHRRIITKKGKRYGADMIGVTRAAAGAISLRNAILTIVPRALVKPALEQAKLVARGATKSLTERRGQVIDKLKKLSALVTNEKILAAVEKRSIDEIGWEEIDHLIGLGTAIKDGMQTVEEAFPGVATVSPEDVLGKPGGTPAPETKTTPEPTTEKPPADEPPPTPPPAQGTLVG